MSLFQPLYSNPLQLSAAVDSEYELFLLMQPLYSVDIPIDEIESQVSYVWSWLKQKHKFKRARRELANSMSLLSTCSGSRPNASHYFEEMREQDITLFNTHPKSRLSRLLSDENVSKASIEQQELKKYTTLLVELIIEADLPLVQVIQSTSSPSAAWLKVFGRRRANTLRNRFRTWKNVRVWMSCNKGYVFPRSVQDMLDYLEEVCSDEGNLVRCGKSVPNSVAAALHLLEHVGMVEDSISSNVLWNNTLQYWNTALSVGRTARKVAPLFPVAIIMSMELYVCDISQPLYLRALAWLWLLMHWCSLRADDCQGLDTHRMLMTHYHWQGVLLQTKTSGPGRKTEELPVFVSKQANLTGADWMKIGFELWQHEPLNFQRDYFVMDADQNWNPKKKFLPPGKMNMFFREILRRLSCLVRPTLLKPWSNDNSSPLLDVSLIPFWTGHSARHWAPSIAATLSVSKEQRDFLGRWALGKQGGSNDYILTSLQIVTSIQNLIAKSLLEGGGSYDESALMLQLKQFLQARDSFVPEVLVPLDVLLHSSNGFCLMCSFPSISTEIVSISHLQDIRVEASSDPVHVEVPNTVATYWVSIQKRSGFRRLHKYSYSACTASKVNCYKTEDVFFLHDRIADARCKICFPSSGKPVDKKTTEEDSISSSQSSSSSISNNEEEYQTEIEGEQITSNYLSDGQSVGSWMIQEPDRETVHIED